MLGTIDLDLYEGVEELVESETFIWAVYLTTAIGSLLVLNYFLHFVIGVGRQWNLIEEVEGKDSSKSFDVISLFSTTSNVVGTARVKRAATRKVNRMLMNAREMHGPATTEKTSETKEAESSQVAGESEALHLDQGDAVFQNYTLRGERSVPAGSLFWTWRKILSGDLFEEEGIWLPSRLLVFQVGQVFFGLFTSVALFYLVDLLAKEADRATARIKFDLAFTDRYYPDWVLDLVPEGKEVRGALIPAASVATFVCFIITVIYLPR